MKIRFVILSTTMRFSTLLARRLIVLGSVLCHAMLPQFGFLLWLSLVLVVGATPVAACSTPVPDSWFEEQISVQNQNLPPGVTINASGTILTMQNSSATPLYILARPDVMPPSIASLPVAPPSGMIASAKLVSNQTFAWSTDVTNNDYSYDWRLGSISEVTLYVAKNMISIGDASVVQLDRRNPFADIRPTKVATPRPQQADMTMVYGDRLLKVPLTISYVLKPSYDPRRGRDPNPCNQAILAAPAPSAPSQQASSLSWLLLPGAIMIVIIVAIVGGVIVAERASEQR